GGGLEGVPVGLLDERLGAVRSQLGADPPVVAPPRKLLVGMLDPDDGNPFPPRLLNKAADVRDDRVALGSPLDDAVLHVDDEECGVRAVLKCGHGLPLLTLAPVSTHGNQPIDGGPELGVRVADIATTPDVTIVPANEASWKDLRPCSGDTDRAGRRSSGLGGRWRRGAPRP